MRAPQLTRQLAAVAVNLRELAARCRTPGGLPGVGAAAYLAHAAALAPSLSDGVDAELVLIALRGWARELSELGRFRYPEQAAGQLHAVASLYDPEPPAGE